MLSALYQNIMHQYGLRSVSVSAEMRQCVFSSRGIVSVDSRMRDGTAKLERADTAGSWRSCGALSPNTANNADGTLHPVRSNMESHPLYTNNQQLHKYNKHTLIM